jgi:hypothetical protein
MSAISPAVPVVFLARACCLLTEEISLFLSAPSCKDSIHLEMPASMRAFYLGGIIVNNSDRVVHISNAQ